MKLSRKQIEAIRNMTPQEIKGKQVSLYASLGYFRPSNANWSYQAGWAQIDGNMVLVVIRFGEIM